MQLALRLLEVAKVTHLMFRTSTTVRGVKRGLQLPMALVNDPATQPGIKDPCVDRLIVQVDEIFLLRTQVRAYLVQNCARSVPTMSWVLAEMFSNLTSGASFSVWMRRNSRRPLPSGTPLSDSRSKPPKRRDAALMEFGLFVAQSRLSDSFYQAIH